MANCKCISLCCNYCRWLPSVSHLDICIHHVSK